MGLTARSTPIYPIPCWTDGKSVPTVTPQLTQTAEERPFLTGSVTQVLLEQEGVDAGVDALGDDHQAPYPQAPGEGPQPVVEITRGLRMFAPGGSASISKS